MGRYKTAVAMLPSARLAVLVAVFLLSLACFLPSSHPESNTHELVGRPVVPTPTPTLEQPIWCHEHCARISDLGNCEPWHQPSVYDQHCHAASYPKHDEGEHEYERGFFYYTPEPEPTPTRDWEAMEEGLSTPTPGPTRNPTPTLLPIQLQFASRVPPTPTLVPLVELGITTEEEAVEKLTQHYQVSREKIYWEPQEMTILGAKIEQSALGDPVLVVEGQLRNSHTIPAEHVINVEGDWMHVWIFEIEFNIEDVSVPNREPFPLVERRVPLETWEATDIWINGQPLLDYDVPPEQCSEHRYGDCPIGCLRACVSSVCSNGICTADCGGPGSCRGP